MRNILSAKNYAIGLLFLIVLLTGCAKSGTIKKMEEVAVENIELQPQEGKALIVFIRPRDLIWKRYPGIFDVSNGELDLVGVLAAQSGVAYQVDSGKHLFMSAGHATGTEFMSANLHAQKTYYVLVQNGVSGFLDTFHLKPLIPKASNKDKIEKQLKALRWIKKNSESDEWVQDNIDNLRLRLDKYDQDQKIPHLRKDDYWQGSW